MKFIKTSIVRIDYPKDNIDKLELTLKLLTFEDTILNVNIKLKPLINKDGYIIPFNTILDKIFGYEDETIYFYSIINKKIYRYDGM